MSNRSKVQYTCAAAPLAARARQTDKESVRDGALFVLKWAVLLRVVVVLAAVFVYHVGPEYDQSSNLIWAEHVLFDSPDAPTSSSAPATEVFSNTSAFARLADSNRAWRLAHGRRGLEPVSLAPNPIGLLRQLKHSVRRALVRWDAAHYGSLAHGGPLSYPMELQGAFMPGIPLLLNLTSSSFYDKLQKRSPGELGWASAILTCNACHVIAAVALYLLLKRLGLSSGSAKASALLFCVQPSAAVQSAPMTESPFAMFTFLGMLAFEHDQGILASLCWFMCSGLRANGILYAGFFAYAALFKKHNMLFCLLKALVVVAPFAGQQVIMYRNFCTNKSVDARPWCGKMLPYSYVQARYWEVGFLNYYEWRRIGDFLLATPFVLRAGNQLLRFTNSLPKSNGKIRHAVSNVYRWIAENRFAPYVVLHAALVIYTMLFAHVYIVLRLFSSLPLLFAEPQPMSRRQRVLSGFWLLYSVGYAGAATALFAMHLSPP